MGFHFHKWEEKSYSAYITYQIPEGGVLQGLHGMKRCSTCGKILLSTVTRRAFGFAVSWGWKDCPKEALQVAVDVWGNKAVIGEYVNTSGLGKPVYYAEGSVQKDGGKTE